MENKGKEAANGPQNVKIAWTIHREISVFAASQGRNLGDVIRQAWEEMKEFHGIVMHMPTYQEKPRRRKSRTLPINRS